MFHLSYKFVIAIIRLVTALIVDLLVLVIKLSMKVLSLVARLAKFVITWRNKSIEGLMIRNRLENAKTYAEWVKIAKSYDKLKGKKPLIRP